MKYLVLIYTQEAEEAKYTPEQFGAMFGEYQAFRTESSKRGALVAGDALQPTSTATTIRVRDGKMLVTDGPFAETKEQLGGYYVLDCPSLDEALELAAMIPGARTGSVEIRPIMVYG